MSLHRLAQGTRRVGGASVASECFACIKWESLSPRDFMRGSLIQASRRIQSLIQASRRIQSLIQASRRIQSLIQASRRIQFEAYRAVNGCFPPDDMVETFFVIRVCFFLLFFLCKSHFDGVEVELLEYTEHYLSFDDSESLL